MDFLKKLFGGNDDNNRPPQKHKRKPLSNPSLAQSQQGLADKSLEELVQLILSASIHLDWREAQMAGGSQEQAKTRQAWTALKEIQQRPNPKAVFDALIPHMNTRPSNLQYQRALGSIDETIAVTPLLKFAKTGQQNERLNALKALGEMKAGTAAEGLVELLYDNDKQIRQEVIRALGFTGHPVAYKALKDYDKDKYPVSASDLSNALRWSNVPETLEEFRRRKAKGDLAIDSTLEQLEKQYATYWQNDSA